MAELSSNQKLAIREYVESLEREKVVSLIKSRSGMPPFLALYHCIKD